MRIVLNVETYKLFQYDYDALFFKFILEMQNTEISDVDGKFYLNQLYILHSFIFIR